MFKTAISAIAIAAATTFCISSANALTIDDFSTTMSLTVLPAPFSIDASVTGLPGAIVGDEREATLFKTIGSDPATLNANAGSSGTLSVGNGTAGKSISTIVWDGAGDSGSTVLDAIGLGGIDFTVGGLQDAFDLRVISSDFSTQITIDIYTDALNASTLTLASPTLVFSSTSMLFEYASFTTLLGSGADFANVGAIVMTIDATGFAATDLELDFFSTTTTQVPEPGPLAALGLGLAGLALMRRRRA